MCGWNMKIKSAISYNLDLLCFLNSMTGNKFIADYHKEAYEKFYPLVDIASSIA